MWLLSFNIMFVRFIHLVYSNCLFSHCCIVFHCVIYHDLFVLFTMGGYWVLSSLWLLWQGAMNIFVHVFWWAYVFISVGCIHKIGISGSKGMQMFRYFTRYYRFSKVILIYIPTSSSPHPWPHLVVSVFFILAILVAVW